MANSVVRLSIDSHEFDANIKRAGEALNKFFDQAKKGDRTFEVLDDDAMEVVKTFGKMETSSKSARGQLSELTKGFTDLSLIYKRLTDEEKTSPVGKEMAKSLGELKARILDTKKDLASINQELSGSKFGQFGGIIDGIGRKMGVSANLTGLLTSKTALMTAGIGAAVTAVYKSTEAWAKYNAELSRQDRQTQVITGLKGSEADHMTDVMRALSDTYKVDFRQAVEVANTLMSQFGVSGSKAIQLIKDGMQGMVQGDGPKLLNMIRQYAPAFRDAGVSASQLVAVIHNTEGGMFTDQNMSAIVMGMKNIRLMTKQTSEALSQLGIDGKQMSKQLNEGTLTVFDALKQVASKLKDVDSNSKVAGEVMQTVFGRQGAMAGTNLATAIETLNTNLEETKKQTGDVGDAFADLQIATEKLNTVIREAFSYDGWEEMATGIKATLVSTLSDVIEKLGEVKGLLAGITPGQARQNKYGTTGTPDEVESDLKALQDADENERDEMYRRMLAKYEKRFHSAAKSLEKARAGYDENENSSNWQGVPFVRKALDRYYWSIQVNTARSNAQVEEEVLAGFRKRANDILNQTDEVPTPPQNDPSTTTESVAAITKELSPMQKAQKEISALSEEALTADEGRLEVIRKEIAALQEQVRVYQSIQDYALGKEPNWNIQVGDRKVFDAEQKKIFEANGGTPSRLESMQYSVMKEIKVENIKVDTETLHTLIKDALQNGIDTTSLDLTPIAEQIGKGINVPDEKWQKILDKYNELRAAIGENPIQIDLSTGNVPGGGQNGKGKGGKGIEGMDVSSLNKITSSVSGIASGLQKLGVEIPEGFEKTIGVLQLITTMISALQTVTSIGAFKPFASGGIVRANDGVFVPGSSYSGDRVPALLNSGEMVLNAFQQEALAGTLQNRYNEHGNESTPYVSGEQIYLGLNNYLKRIGRGEMLTARG